MSWHTCYKSTRISGRGDNKWPIIILIRLCSLPLTLLQQLYWLWNNKALIVSSICSVFKSREDRVLSALNQAPGKWRRSLAHKRAPMDGCTYAHANTKPAHMWSWKRATTTHSTSVPHLRGGDHPRGPFDLSNHVCVWIPQSLVPYCPPPLRSAALSCERQKEKGIC